MSCWYIPVCFKKSLYPVSFSRYSARLYFHYYFDIILLIWCCILVIMIILRGAHAEAIDVICKRWYTGLNYVAIFSWNFLGCHFRQFKKWQLRNIIIGWNALWKLNKKGKPKDNYYWYGWFELGNPVFPFSVRLFFLIIHLLVNKVGRFFPILNKSVRNCVERKNQKIVNTLICNNSYLSKFVYAFLW